MVLLFDQYIRGLETDPVNNGLFLVPGLNLQVNKTMSIVETAVLFLIITQMTTMGVIVWLLLRMKRQEDRVEKTPTVYTTAIERKHEEFITEVTKHLNHEHAIALIREDVTDSPLFYYTTYAMVNDVPVEKCASNIAWLLDELVQQQEAEEAELANSED